MTSRLEALTEGISEHIPPGHYSKKMKMTNHFTMFSWNEVTQQQNCAVLGVP